MAKYKIVQGRPGPVKEELENLEALFGKEGYEIIHASGLSHDGYLCSHLVVEIKPTVKEKTEV